MKFNKTIISLSVMSLLTAAIVSIGFSKASVFNAEAAQSIAAAYVPYTSQAAGIEDQPEDYAVHFLDGDVAYTVKVDKVHENAASVQTVYRSNSYGSTVGLNENNIREIIQHSVPDARIESAALQSVNDQKYYEVVYDTSTTHTTVHLNAQNGNTIDRTTEYNSQDNAYTR